MITLTLSASSACSLVSYLAGSSVHPDDRELTQDEPFETAEALVPMNPQNPITLTSPASSVSPVASDLKLNDLVPTQLGPCPGTTPGGPSETVEAPVPLPRTTLTLPASSAPSLFPGLASSSSEHQRLIDQTRTRPPAFSCCVSESKDLYAT